MNAILLVALFQGHHLENNFILLGNCPNPYSYIRSADICVQPSSYEGFSLSVLEDNGIAPSKVQIEFSAEYQRDFLKNLYMPFVETADASTGPMQALSLSFQALRQRFLPTTWMMRNEKCRMQS